MRVLISFLLLAFGDAFSSSREKSASPFGLLRTPEPSKKSDPAYPRSPTSLFASRKAQKVVSRTKWLENRGVSVSSETYASSNSNAPIKIIIAGAPASGKGTQCEMIKEKYGVVHLSTGDMLRAAVADKTEVGLKAKEFMDSGKLVPDEVIIGIVQDRLAESDCESQGWLLDGFPRTAAQAQALSDAGVCADCFIFLNVPDEVLIERVVGRRTDPVTGKIYHMTFSPPEDDEVAARLEQRSDDTEEKARVRLEQFHTNVDAVKDSYTDISVTIDGNQDKSIVTQAVFDAIDSKVMVES